MNKTLFLLAAFGFTLLAGCKTDSDLPPMERYEQDLAASLASDQRTNGVFLDLDLGIARKEFYDRCTVLNQQQRITMNGSLSNAVDYKLEDELPRVATLTLAPDFGEDRKSVKAMTALFSYDDWSPWNKESHSVQLLQDLYKLLTSEYGSGFYVVPHDKLGKVLVQFNNNRRIAAWVKDERYVQVRFTDLAATPEEPLGLLE